MGIKIVAIKFLLFCLLFAGTAGKLYAQGDTTAVLNNLLANKAAYIGQSCTKLLNDLPLAIKYFRGPLPFPHLPDILNISSINLSFVTLQEVINNITPINVAPSRKCPYILIYFTNFIATPKRLFKQGQIFDAMKDDWSVNHAIYFGSAIVADFRIYGL